MIIKKQNGSYTLTFVGNIILLKALKPFFQYFLSSLLEMYFIPEMYFKPNNMATTKAIVMIDKIKPSLNVVIAS